MGRRGKEVSAFIPVVKKGNPWELFPVGGGNRRRNSGGEEDRKSPSYIKPVPCTTGGKSRKKTRKTRTLNKAKRETGHHCFSGAKAGAESGELQTRERSTGP